MRFMVLNVTAVNGGSREENVSSSPLSHTFRSSTRSLGHLEFRCGRNPNPRRRPRRRNQMLTLKLLVKRLHLAAYVAALAVVFAASSAVAVRADLFYIGSTTGKLCG